MEPELVFQIILVKPPPEVVFGLQKGSGNAYETVQKQFSNSEDLIIRFTARARGDREKDSFPNFSGSFVQGPAAGQFVYIDIGTYAGQQGSIWARRLKIPLTGITWKDIDSFSGHSVFEASVPGTGKDGGPNCAMVKPFGGWHLKQQ